ncbi:MAG: TraB/TrbI/VirB10 family type IV secretion system protein [Acidiferrobacterales bacterium]
MPADQTPKDPQDPVEDIVGPGRTEKVLKPVPTDTGPRISGRAKGLALGGAVLLVGAVAGGVLWAGHTPGKRRRAERAALEPAELVGQAAPPVPPLAPPPALLGTGPLGAGSSSGSLASAGWSSGASGVPPIQAGTSAQQALDYRTWRVQQGYKVLKQQVRAQQAALSAPITQGGDVRTAAASGSVFPVPPQPLMPGAGLETAGAAQATRPDAGQAANRRFLGDQRRRRARNGDLHQILEKPTSSHELFAGSVLPAVLLTGIDSDLPGEVVAQVRQNIYNSLDPGERLIPQGARLIGVYSSAVTYGQQRALVAWRRIIFPDGATIALEGMPGTDSLGRAGFQDLVDNHYGRIFGSAFLVSMLGAGAQLAQPQNGGLLNTPTAEQQAAANLANEMNHVGTHLLNKNLSIQPTLKIRPGYLFDVLVTRTMILPPYP